MGIGKGTGRGGARPGAGKPKGSKAKWPGELAAELRGLSEIVTRLAETLRDQQETLTRLNENSRNEREALQPILRRLVEIERKIGLRETMQAPRVTRRRPLGVQ